jgi:hypothetical protein
LKDFQTKLCPLFAPHPRQHQGEQLFPKQPLQILAQFQIMIKQSCNYETNLRSYTFCAFANQLIFEHHHQNYTSNII